MYDMENKQSQYSRKADSDEEFKKEIRRALSLFQNERFNYFIAAFYPEDLATIMGIASEMGLAGPGKFWMLSGTADTAPYVLSGKFIVEKSEWMQMYPTKHSFDLTIFHVLTISDLNLSARFPCGEGNSGHRYYFLQRWTP